MMRAILTHRFPSRKIGVSWNASTILRDSGAQPELLKEINCGRLLAILQKERTISRAELARRADLSRTTVGILVDEFLQAGLAREVGRATSTGGRPPMMLEFNPNAALALGAYLTDRSWDIVLANLDAQVLQRVGALIVDDTCAHRARAAGR